MALYQIFDERTPMKPNRKHYLKRCMALLSFLLLLCKCQKEEYGSYQAAVPEEVYPNVTYFSKNTLPPEVMGKLDKSIEPHLKQTSSKKSNLETSFGTILTDRIMLSINDEGIENYTFKVALDDNDPKTFYNLILRKNIDSSFTAPYLKKYVMSEAFYADYAAGNTTMAFFEGTYANYNVDKTIDADLLLGKTSKFSEDCIVPINDDITDDDFGDPVDNNNDGPGSGGQGNGMGVDNGGQMEGGATVVVCTSSLVANICNGGGGHYGEDPGCTGSFKGSIQVVTVCSDGSVTQQDLNKGMAKGGDCPNDEGDVGVLEEDADPCKTFTKLANNTEFKNKLQQLRNKAMNDNKETAYKMTSTGFNQYDYAIREGDQGELGLDPDVGDNEQIDGFIHNHNNDPQNRDLSIFSPNDLYTLYKWLKNGNVANKNNFVYAVTTAQGTTYALTIQSKSKFIAFGDAVLEGLQNNSNNTLGYEYEGSNGSHLQDFGGINNGNSNALNETNFLNLLDFANAGVGLYKANYNFDDWQELEYNPNTNSVTSNPCN